MAGSGVTEDSISPAATPGRPQQQFEVQEPTTSTIGNAANLQGDPSHDENEPDDMAYPTGTKRWLAVSSLFAAAVLHGLDLTIVAAAIPSLTNDFHTLDDIGWYSSAYSLMAASFSFVWSRLYTRTSHTSGPKWTYLAALCIFELGSLLCTVAPTSSMLGIVSSPIVGGALIDWLRTWRGCFGINLPLGAAAIVFIVFGFKGDVGLISRTAHHLREFDILGTFLMLPAITTFLLALQWGGNRHPWTDSRIIALFVLSAVLLGAFAWRQRVLLESRATLPPRIVKMRSVLAGAWFTACTNATLAVTEYYVTIYFQGVRGLSAMQSGLMMLPMLIGITVGGLLSGVGISRMGYYNPFMIAATLLAPVAAGLLTTTGLDDPDAKVPSLLGFLGVAVGLGIQTPTIALQTVMKPADLPMGIALLGFGATMGNAVWIVVSAALFQGRLGVEIAAHLASAAGGGGGGAGAAAGGEVLGNLTHTILTGEVGLSEIRDLVGGDRLRDVLLGYDEALTQTMYLPLALTIAMVVGCVFTEWQSVKKKQS
ncbi:major facilitator superfamily domain-containing protein [Microdochium trichocladiopsis]|uniref:Major facilitator superfamily domain-containing protein n=1 Tax=Microdochium trichocladiopsis TaxID=1682393 RepID=A0A9P8XV81_9PEZI|nr:major facilitator superfamily domain-containing protein [Microdochium trichocladiopsis]KAH7020779.1 major facilitator superfamily domain-containing protein [Microdochium trichocladiopsis]